MDDVVELRDGTTVELALSEPDVRGPLVSHDRTLVRAHADVVVGVRDGRVTGSRTATAGATGAQA